MPPIADPPNGRFYIQTIGDRRHFFEADLGDGPAMVVDGYGGYTVVSRPRRVGLTDWPGRNPVAIEVPFVIDRTNVGFGGGNQTERDIWTLEQIAGLGDHDDPPPECLLNGGGWIPHDYHNSSTTRWVVEALAWDADLEIRNRAGNRERAGGRLTFRQVVRDRVLEDVTSAEEYRRRVRQRRRGRRQGRKGGQEGGAGRPYVVKSGDTLSSIAARELNNPRRWKDIAELNNIRDPRRIRVGQRLKMPK